MANYNILYVDDEESNLRAFKLLYRRKFNIITAGSGKEGLKIMASKPIHLVITDQRMPEMTGIEFLKKVKKKWPEPKYILLTGFTDNEAIKEAINDVGIYWYMNKPFDTDKMEYLMNYALEAYSEEKEKKVVDEKLKTILSTALDAIITIDKNQIITMANQAVVNMFGYKESELLGQSVEILIPKEIKNHKELIEGFELSSDSSRMMQSINVVHGVSKNGKLVPIEAAISKMELDGERYYNAIIRDISDRIEAENKIIKLNQNLEKRILERTKALEEAKKDLEKRAEELSQASSYKSQFLANMSHELRTPLNSILLLSKLLEENTANNLTNEQIEFAAVINDSGSDLLALINEVLDLSKIESGKMEIELEEVEMSSLQKTFEGLFKPLAKEKDILFKWVIDKKAFGQIITDRLRLEQVLKNLLSNAIKFTGKKGSVEMRIFNPARGTHFENPILKNNSVICFEVKDSGIGIAKEKLKLIFEPFEQADGSTGRKFGGTGLGLSISRDIAGMLGGELILNSTEGMGSTFTLYLPTDGSSSIVEDNGLVTNRSVKI